METAPIKHFDITYANEYDQHINRVIPGADRYEAQRYVYQNYLQRGGRILSVRELEL